MDMEKTRKERTSLKKVKWAKEKKEDNGQSSIYNKHYQRFKASTTKDHEASCKTSQPKTHEINGKSHEKENLHFQTAHNRAMRSVGK